MHDHARGAKMRRRANKSGRKPEDERDIEMALEFEKKKEHCRKNGSYSVLSDTALKVRIGLDYNLKPRAAIYAIDRGRKLLCKQPS
jgi:hypothetical protein